MVDINCQRWKEEIDCDGSALTNIDNQGGMHEFAAWHLKDQFSIVNDYIVFTISMISYQ